MYACFGTMILSLDLRLGLGNIVVYGLCKLHVEVINICICTLRLLPMSCESRAKHAYVDVCELIFVLATRTTLFESWFQVSPDEDMMRKTCSLQSLATHAYR